uniref:Uncharacterized protein n=1 Tax=Siphoviridae sp. ctX581 TaxID=2826365 RepID=A0A8S5ME90_9CAUD|nr:MAG TPA: hypothetical protein [Siphoviridae sp. ctX581]
MIYRYNYYVLFYGDVLGFDRRRSALTAIRRLRLRKNVIS